MEKRLFEIHYGLCNGEDIEEMSFYTHAKSPFEAVEEFVTREGTYDTTTGSRNILLNVYEMEDFETGRIRGLTI